MLLPASSPTFTLKSMSLTLSVVMLFPFTLHVMPLPMSNTMVTSLPAIVSRTSPGTTVAPFISTFTASPSFASDVSFLITSQPSLPVSSLMNGFPVSGISAGFLSPPSPGLLSPGLLFPGLLSPGLLSPGLLSSFNLAIGFV